MRIEILARFRTFFDFELKGKGHELSRAENPSARLETHHYYVVWFMNKMFIILLSRLHGKDNVAIKRYVISFWNGIDLRYKLLKDPGVKISIAGIIISRVRYFCKPSENHMTFTYGDGFLVRDQ